MGPLLVCVLYAYITRKIVFSILIRWNASRAFASYLDAHPEIYYGGSVLELGAGGGLPGLVAAKNGAKSVNENSSPCELIYHPF
jgi:predicted nicotinamide N-methyase